MPHHSLCNELLDKLDEVHLALKKARLQWAIRSYNLSNSDSDDLDDLQSDDSLDNHDSPYTSNAILVHVLHHPNAPPMRAPQIQLLHNFGDSRPHLFRKKLHVNPDIFDDILDQISGHTIFTNRSNNTQLPIAVQLAIFHNHIGHYSNTISPEDVAQWAGVSIGSVTNCSNHIMVAILDLHDIFIVFPTLDSDDTENACKFVEARSCPEWRNGIFAVDGSAINLYEKLGLYSEAFYDRKSNYSFNCQGIIMPHNLLIVDYSLGHPGSMHDASTFKSTHIYQEHDALLQDDHWI
ncbi:hypothetical protein P692DRAFT_20871076 [Suillus brevipes Sb2]|nr:hypothetical protein P692DRAFT_20871076 [Suillus brevipes Sb2]